MLINYGSKKEVSRGKEKERNTEMLNNLHTESRIVLFKTSTGYHLISAIKLYYAAQISFSTAVDPPAAKLFPSL